MLETQTLVTERIVAVDQVPDAAAETANWVAGHLSKLLAHHQLWNATLAVYTLSATAWLVSAFQLGTPAPAVTVKLGLASCVLP
jgi:hypothetical protein